MLGVEPECGSHLCEVLAVGPCTIPSCSVGIWVRDMGNENGISQCFSKMI